MPITRRQVLSSFALAPLAVRHAWAAQDAAAVKICQSTALTGPLGDLGQAMHAGAMLGGERKTIVIESEPAYNAFYEIESPAVLTSDAWAKAVEEGRWAEQVRPYTTNRRHVIYRRIS